MAPSGIGEGAAVAAAVTIELLRANGALAVELVRGNPAFAATVPAVVLVAVALFRYETGIPAWISTLVVAPMTGLGFVVAYGLHVWLAVSMLQAVGMLCAALVPVLIVYDLYVSGRRSPIYTGPPSRNG